MLEAYHLEVRCYIGVRCGKHVIWNSCYYWYQMMWEACHLEILLNIGARYGKKCNLNVLLHWCQIWEACHVEFLLLLLVSDVGRMSSGHHMPHMLH